MRVRRWVVAGLLFGVLWVFVRGPPLAARPVAGQFLFGTAVGLPVAFLFRRLYERGLSPRRSLRSVPFVLGYVAVFTKEVLVANLDMTYRVLAPGMPIDPQVILVPMRVETDLGVTTIANSISITPGTLSLDHDPDENALYVHVVDGRDPDRIVAPIRTWENYALEIFDEPRSPEDPAPEITVHPPDHPPEPKRHVEAVEAVTAAEESTESGPVEERGPEGAPGDRTDGVPSDRTDGTSDDRADGVSDERTDGVSDDRADEGVDHDQSDDPGAPGGDGDGR